MMKLATHILTGLFFVAFLAVVSVFLASLLPIPGQVEIKIVKSGSMEPAIQTGGIVVIQPATSYGVGDVITFGEDTAVQVPTTHRILREYKENGQTYFETKGDANEEADTEPVLAHEVVGKVLFSVPYAGYMLDFAKQPFGFVFMIGIPAALIILYEFLGIVGEIRKLKKSSRGGKEGGGGTPKDARGVSFYDIYEGHKGNRDTVVFARVSPLQDMYVQYALFSETAKKHNSVARSGTLLMVGLLLPVSLILGNVEATVLYFSNIEASVGNTFAAGPLDFSLSPGGDLSATIGSGETEGFALSPVVVPVTDNIPFSYTIKALVGGDTTLCSSLQISGTSPPFSYSGPAGALSTAPTSEVTPWNILFFVPMGASLVEGAQCQVDLVYSAFQHNGAVGIEYHDEEHITILLTYTNTPPLLAPLQLFSLPEEGTGEVLGTTTPPEERNIASSTPETLPEDVPSDTLPEDVPPLDPPGEELPPEEPPAEDPPAVEPPLPDPAPEPPPSDPPPTA